MRQRLLAEGIGSFFLFATVIGSGAMAENLSGGNVAVALLGNTLATTAMLFVLITMLGPISGAHFNPAASLVFRLRGELNTLEAFGYVAAQLLGGMLGIWTAHLMFDLPIVEISTKARTGFGQWTGEGIATFGLVLTILATLRAKREWVPVSPRLLPTVFGQTVLSERTIKLGQALPLFGDWFATALEVEIGHDGVH